MGDGKNERSISIFCSYALEDKDRAEILKNHIAGNYNHIVWYDRVKIPPGDDQQKKIDHYLNTADIILLLASADFMVSDACSNIEVPRAMRRHKAKEAIVVTILLRPIPTSWRHPEFMSVKVLPTGKKAVATWRNKEDAFVDIANNMHLMINKRLKELYIEDAKIHLESEKKDDACQVCHLALEQSCPDVTLSKELGDLFHKLGCFEEALIAYREAIEICKNGDDNQMKAQLYENCGDLLPQLSPPDFAGSLAAFNEAIRIDSNNFSLYEKKGDMLSTKKFLEEAFYKKKSDVLSTKNDLEEALKMYNDAIKRKPPEVRVAKLWKKKAEVFVNLAKIDSEKALEAYEEAIKYSSGDASEKALVRTKGSVLVDLGQLEEGLEEYDRAIDLDPGNHYFYKEKGDVLLGINHLSEALLAYNKAIHLKPDFELAKECREKVLQAMETQSKKIAADLEQEKQSCKPDEDQEDLEEDL